MLKFIGHAKKIVLIMFKSNFQKRQKHIFQIIKIQEKKISQCSYNENRSFEIFFQDTEYNVL